MRINTVKSEFYNLCKTVDKEIMTSEGNPELRPCLIIMKLKYKGKKKHFAIPVRSNISKNVPKSQYVKLPNTAKTKKGNRAGLHFSKMFPIDKMFLIKYNEESNGFKKAYEKLSNNFNKIVNEAQNYLSNYEDGVRDMFCTNIDKLSRMIDNYMANIDALEEVATTADVHNDEKHN